MFSGLNHAEREAFFGLLDEYFESRPHNRPPSSSTTRPARAPSSSSAYAAPVPPPAPARPASTASHHTEPASASSPAPQTKSPVSFLAGKNPHVDNLMANKHVAGALGAASNAWSSRHQSHDSSSTASAPPPAPAPKPAAGRGHAAPSGLVSSKGESLFSLPRGESNSFNIADILLKGIGGFNTTSKGAAFGSLIGNKV